MGRLRDSLHEARVEAEALFGALERGGDAVQALDSSAVRVALPVVVPDAPSGGGGGGGGGGDAPGNPAFPVAVGLGTAGGATATSSSKGGGTGGDRQLDPWLRSYAPDSSFVAKLSDVIQGEPTTIGLSAGRIVPGWIFAGYVFIDPSASGAGARVSSRSGGGSINHGAGAGGGRVSTRGGRVGNPAQSNTLENTLGRREASSTVAIVSGLDRLRGDLGSKLDRVSSQLEGGGMAAAIRRAR